MTADTLSDAFAALADPTRRAMLARLAQGPATVGELARPHAISLPAASRHLKVLERAGLLIKGRDGQRRPCRLRSEPLRDVALWLATYRTFMEERLDRLEEHLGVTPSPSTSTPGDLP